MLRRSRRSEPDPDPQVVAARRIELGLRDWTAGPAEPAGRLLCDPSELDRWKPVEGDDQPVELIDQTNASERAWVTRHIATADLPAGAIVELGSLFGSITSAIGDGLRRRRPDDRRPFHTYDRFRFEHQAQLLDDVPDLLTYSEGGSFREVFDRRIVSVAEHVTVHEGEIEEQTWHPDAPIAFLFNDISKSWTTWLAVRRAFYRALVPGSVVVEQDFAHAYVPWLHLTHCRWREHFEVLGWIPGSTSLVMRVVSPIPACELDRDDLVAGYTPRELQLAFDWAESVGMPEHRASIRGARIMLYILHGDLDVATRELATATAAGLLDDSTIASVYAPLADRIAPRYSRPVATLRSAEEEALRFRENRESALEQGLLWRAY